MFFRRISKEKQRRIAAVLAFLLIGALILGIILPFVSYAEEKNDIVIKGEIGFTNRYKVGGTTQINIEITNEGQDFRGEVQVKVIRQDYGNVLDNIIYAKDIEIPKGSTKKVSMTVNAVNMQRSFDILLKAGDKAVAKKTIYVTAFPPERGFIGVLSEDASSLNYLRDLKFDQIVGNRLIELNENIFPTDLEILNDFDAIIINNYDTTKLSEEKKDILNDWVSKGGVLILGTGPNADKVLKGLDSKVIPVINKGITNVTDFFEMEQLGGKILDSSQPLQSSILEIEEGIDVLFSGDLPITTLINQGSGNIVIHYFDLGLNPIAQWDGNRYMLSELYMKYVPVFAQMNQVEDKYYYDASSYSSPYALRLFPRPQQNGLMILVLIMIGVYIIIAGPILYWILKVKDKREYGWFIIPIIALSFSGLIYLLSINTIFRFPIGSSIGIASIKPGEISSTINVAAGFFTPNTGENKITFTKDINPKISYVDNSLIYRNRGISNNEKREYTSAKIKMGEEKELTFYNEQAWAMSTINGVQDVKFEGPINASITFKDNKIIGTIQNHMGFDLETCILAVGNNYYFLDKINNNDTINIEKEISSNPKNRYEAFDEIFGPIYDRKGMEEKWKNKLSKEEFQRLIQRREIFQNFSDRNYTTFQKRAGINFSNPNIKGDSAIFLYGFNEQPFLEHVMVNGIQIKNYNQNLFIIPLEIDYTKMNTVEIPYGFIRPYVTSNVGFNIDDYDQSIYIHNSGSLDFIYTIDPNIKLSLFQIQFTKSSNVEGAYIHNNDSGVWEELSNLPYEEDLLKYCNSEGEIQIRFEVVTDDKNGDRLEFPKFRMKGDKK